MTTIVARAGEGMAADTAVVNIGPRYHADKLFRIGLSIFGTAGDGDMGLVMVEWLKSPARNKQVLYKLWGDYERSEVVLLEVNPSGLYIWTGWGMPERIHEKFYAIGSGSMAAIEALNRGDSLINAVRAAVRWDENSDIPVQVETLKVKKRAR